MSLAAAKTACRKHAAAVLKRVPRTSLDEQARAVCEAVKRLPAFQHAQNVSIYLSMPTGELDTWALSRAALTLGKRLYVPRFSTLSAGASASENHKFTTDMQMLRVHDVQELDHGLTANKWGIAEPPPLRAGAAREDALLTGGAGLDLIIVPGMLFDTHGGRLGHGKGYYDRYIRRAHAFAQERKGRVPYIVAVALREQISDDPVPTGDTDEPIDALVTADHTWVFRGEEAQNAEENVGHAP
ncbi:hypothetical protein MBRA1_002741 [Malassezia brasiliensis]|uniref:5-formyltetrahydrofolate cyclo-ligase n=1 Tax=Malassezia brasiliensis TaxID=1821822 RepID=A0AAF0DYV9_9BASI|nr:hypothetical protein MBRA1_002741 [Malassezia brasiliensis]